MTRLKDLAIIDRASLPETTDPDRQFRYVDIGSVDSTGRIGELAELRFADAPSRARRLVLPGDSIVSTVRTYLRAIAHIGPEATGLVASTGFATLTPRPGVLPGYLKWAVRSSEFIEGVVARSVGVSYPAITSTELGRIAIPLPDIEQQQRIADYLDAETARVDELIAEQQRQRELIEEHRHARISVALGARLGGPSSGLDGVLCQLPDGWELIPLRAVAVIQSGLTLGKAYDGKLEERPYLRVANVQSGSLDLAEVSTIEVPAVVANRCGLRDGDVLMTEGGDNDKLGRGTVWRNEIEGCLHQNHIFAVRPQKHRLRPMYLAYLTGSSWGRAYFTATAHQTTNLAATNRTKVGRFPIPLPPPDEQDRILSELLGSEQRLTALDAALEGQILLLQEHRQALITHAVTQGVDGFPGVA